jgi:tetratricopeptide (TPR) repeat protein
MQLLSRLNLRSGSLILFAVSFLLYINTVSNQYALDDEVVVTNTQVAKGFSGLGEIFTSDIFSSYYAQNNAEQQLSGGRYRPLSVATFAIEYAIFGNNPAPRHCMNVLLYALLSVLIFYTLAISFRIDLAVSFIIAFLFAIHPIHTEVVANIKSRDEILSLLFIMLTFIYFFKYIDAAKTKDLLLTMLMFVLAFLSKEYAVSLLVLLPLAVWLFRTLNITQAIAKTWWSLAVFAIYAGVRIKMVGTSSFEPTDPLSNPFVYATTAQAWATKFYIAGKYLLLLFVPYPLSADYSFQQIPYQSFGNVAVIASLLVYAGIIAWLLYALKQRSKVAFAILLFGINLLLVGNFVFNIGATMGERLVFHSSLGFCMVLGFGFDLLKKRVGEQQVQTVAAGVLAVLLVAAAFIIVPRNRDWYNTHTLFIHDVKVVPNSILANSNAGVAYVDLSVNELDRAKKDSLNNIAIQYTHRSLQLHPGYLNSLINLGVQHFNAQRFDSAFYYYDLASAKWPTFDILQKNAHRIYSEGCNNGRLRNFNAAVMLIEQAVKMAPDSANFWGDLGGAYLSVGRVSDAKRAWDTAIKLNPTEHQAINGLPLVNKIIAEQANVKTEN